MSDQFATPVSKMSWYDMDDEDADGEVSTEELYRNNELDNSSSSGVGTDGGNASSSGYDGGADGTPKMSKYPNKSHGDDPKKRTYGNRPQNRGGRGRGGGPGGQHLPPRNAHPAHGNPNNSRFNSYELPAPGPDRHHGPSGGDRHANTGPTSRRGGASGPTHGGGRGGKGSAGDHGPGHKTQPTKLDKLSPYGPLKPTKADEEDDYEKQYRAHHTKKRPTHLAPVQKRRPVEDSYDGDGEASDHNSTRMQPRRNPEATASSDDDRASPLRQRPDESVLLKVKIALKTGEKEILVRRGDDPIKLAEAFCTLEHLAPSMASVIAQVIVSNLESLKQGIMASSQPAATPASGAAASPSAGAHSAPLQAADVSDPQPSNV